MCYSFRNLTPTDLWRADDRRPWDDLLKAYWAQPTVIAVLDLCKNLEHLKREEVLGLEDHAWYQWLRDSFIPWSERRWLGKRQRDLDAQWGHGRGRTVIGDARTKVETAMEKGGAGDAIPLLLRIAGFGPSSVAALLALLFPESCAAASEGVMRFLHAVSALPQRARLLAIGSPKPLTDEAVLLLMEVFREKAASLNREFGLHCWTPRLVERCVWTYDSDASVEQRAGRS